MNTAEAFLILFAGFLTVLSGAIAMPQELFPNSRIIILATTGLACLGVGIIFYHHTRPKQQTIFKPVTSVPNRWKRLRMAFFVGLGFFEVTLLLPLPFFSWQFAFVDGVPVITLLDLFLVGSFVLALYIARSLYRFFKLSAEERLDYF
jgi:hypothetical protein